MGPFVHRARSPAQSSAGLSGVEASVEVGYICTGHCCQKIPLGTSSWKTPDQAESHRSRGAPAASVSSLPSTRLFDMYRTTCFPISVCLLVKAVNALYGLLSATLSPPVLSPPDETGMRDCPLWCLQWDMERGKVKYNMSNIIYGSKQG